MSTVIHHRRAFQARSIKRVVGTLSGVLGLTVILTQVAPLPAAHAASNFSYRRGYSLQQGWLCYGWSSGAYHCSPKWHRSAAGHMVSDNPGWVPGAGNSAPTRYAPRGGQSTWRAGVSSGGSAGGSVTAPSGIGPWVATGHSAYAMSDFAGDPHSSVFGSCTWWPWYHHQNEPLMQLGNAAQWLSNAPAHGLATGTEPSVGATVVFQPGVQGASGMGHVGYVESVLGGGWFMISEMSFTWNGGGWGRVSYRYVHTGSGVGFIY